MSCYGTPSPDAFALGFRSQAWALGPCIVAPKTGVAPVAQGLMCDYTGDFDRYHGPVRAPSSRHRHPGGDPDAQEGDRARRQAVVHGSRLQAVAPNPPAAVHDARAAAHGAPAAAHGAPAAAHTHTRAVVHALSSHAQVRVRTHAHVKVRRTFCRSLLAQCSRVATHQVTGNPLPLSDSSHLGADRNSQGDPAEARTHSRAVGRDPVAGRGQEEDRNIRPAADTQAEDHTQVGEARTQVGEARTRAAVGAHPARPAEAMPLSMHLLLPPSTTAQVLYKSYKGSAQHVILDPCHVILHHVGAHGIRHPRHTRCRRCTAQIKLPEQA
jgi:hypothetical protein